MHTTNTRGSGYDGDDVDAAAQAAAVAGVDVPFAGTVRMGATACCSFASSYRVGCTAVQQSSPSDASDSLKANLFHPQRMAPHCGAVCWLLDAIVASFLFTPRGGSCNERTNNGIRTRNGDVSSLRDLI